LTLAPLWIAGRFLTRFPFPDPGALNPADLGRAVPWYPAVGLALGGAVALTAAVAGPWVLQAPAPAVAALALALWAWSTGGLHLDGLADTADAWVGGMGSRERTLEIMKDPVSGPAGVSTLVLALILKYACIQSLLAAGEIALLVWVPMLARAQLPLLLISTPYARPQGMAGDPARSAPRRACGLAIGLAGGAAMLGLGWWSGLAAVAAAGGLFWLMRRSLMRRLGGFTGDTAGALVELTEALLLLVLALGRSPT
jgi:adenosylcobinamide-GDP ribazoletransferase